MHRRLVDAVSQEVGPGLMWAGQRHASAAVTESPQLDAPAAQATACETFMKATSAGAATTVMTCGSMP